MWFPNGCNTISPVQSQKQARSLKFRFKKKRDCTIGIVKAKALISCAVTVPKMFSHLQNVGFQGRAYIIYNVVSCNITINIGV